MPIRPLVNFTTAPGYKLSSKLDKILRQNIKLEKDYSLRNSLDFVDKTKDLSVENHKTMASLDIVNLFTNVPVKKL